MFQFIFIKIEDDLSEEILDCLEFGKRYKVKIITRYLTILRSKKINRKKGEKLICLCVECNEDFETIGDVEEIIDSKGKWQRN